MMISLRFLLVLLTPILAGGISGNNDHTRNLEAAAEVIAEIMQEVALANLSTTNSDVIVEEDDDTLTEEERNQHDTNGTLEHSLLERNREGTNRKHGGGKYSRGNSTDPDDDYTYMKGSKSDKYSCGNSTDGNSTDPDDDCMYMKGAKKGKSGKAGKNKGGVKGKSKKSKAGDDDDDDDDDDDGDNTDDDYEGFRQEEDQVNASFVPSQTFSPSISPVAPYNAPTLTRIIPAFRVEYFTNENDVPGTDAYDALVDVTRDYLDESLENFFGSINDVQYVDTNIEFYYIRGIFLLEYQFKTSWAIGQGQQVPSIQELNVVVMEFFGSSMQTYINKLNDELASTNVFQSTTMIGDGSGAGNPILDDRHDVDPEEMDVSTTQTLLKNVVIPVVAVTSVLAAVILILYVRRRKHVETGDESDRVTLREVQKPDDDTFGTHPSLISPFGSMLEDDLADQRSLAQDIDAIESYNDVYLGRN